MDSWGRNTSDRASGSDVKRQAMAPSSPAAAAADSYAHDVLADQYLLRHIVSFQRGLPGLLVLLEREHADRLTTPGILAKLAVEKDDERVIAALLQAGRDFPQLLSLRKMDLSEAVHYAATLGRLRLLQWLHAHTEIECRPWTFAAAARCGHVPVLQWLQTHRPESMAKFLPFSMDRVAETGRVDVFQWLETHVGVACTTSAMDSAALNGHLEMVTYLHEHRTEGCTPLAMDVAALKGHLPILRFLHERRTEGCTPWAMDSAATYGRLDVIQFLHEHRTEGCTVKAMNEAAARGRMDIVTFLHENRREGCDKYAIRGAARNGHVEMVRFLHETFHEQHCTRESMVAAAEDGRLEVVRYLNEHCEASNGAAIVSAAQYGHVAVVEYLVANRNDGCLVAAQDKARKAGHEEVVALLAQYIAPGVTSCSASSHGRKDARRVCQRQQQ